jgi:hypothetical protein
MEIRYVKATLIAAHNAENAFKRWINELSGIAATKEASKEYKGNPVGCAIPRVPTTAASSPLSTKVTTGANV